MSARTNDERRSSSTRNSTPQSITDAPEEILQHIFLFASFNLDEKRDPLLLPRICSVNRRWRQAAMSYPPLWATLPPIDLNTPDSEDIRRTRDAAAFYLARSGSLPISFELKCEREFEPVSDNLLVEVIELLVSKCERWKSVSIWFCMPWFSYLFPPTRDRLHALVDLELNADTYPWRHFSPQVCDIFAGAPNLRRVRSNMRWLNHDGELVPGPFKLALPLPQLESVTYISPLNEIYPDIMDAPPCQLHTLIYAVQGFRLLPSVTASILPQLTALRLRAGIFYCNILSHMDTLILPALDHLEIWGEISGGVAHHLYHKTSSLVRRSGCSLRRLALGASPGRSHDSDQAFLRLLLLCPDLESLNIPLPESRSNMLRMLAFDASTPTRTVPKLRELGLHYHALSMPTEFDLRVGYDIALVEIIQSRARLGERSLEEVGLFWGDTMALHDILFHQNSAFDDIDGKAETRVAQRLVPNVRRTLHCHFKEYISFHLYEDQRMSFMWNMNRVMWSLETLGLSKVNTAHLMRSGYLQMLHRVGQAGDKMIHADSVFHFRSRARRLCAKWKPFVLRDARRLGHRWCQYEDGCIRLKWNKPGESDEDMWKDIIGENKPADLDPKRWSG